MDGCITACKKQDELIDTLVEAGYIHMPWVQKAFRAVNRTHYYCAKAEGGAYRDLVWKFEGLFTPVPLVNHCEIMEELHLTPGLSFLNLGSGSGYINTMAGIILGPYGINHGIELNPQAVEFAESRLEDFIGKENAIDQYNFGRPTFYTGNALLIDSNSQQYDRVLCLLTCPEEHDIYLRHLIKIGGILIISQNGKFVKITRTSESTWSNNEMISNSFAPVLTPPSILKDENVNFIRLGDFCPPKLKDICRDNIRSISRGVLNKNFPHLITKRRFVDLQFRRQGHANSDLVNVHSHSSELTTITDLRISARISVHLEGFIEMFTHLQTISKSFKFLLRMYALAPSIEDLLTEQEEKDTDYGSSYRVDKSLVGGEPQPSTSKESEDRDESFPFISKPPIFEEFQARNESPPTLYPESELLEDTRLMQDMHGALGDNIISNSIHSMLRERESRKRPADDDESTSNSEVKNKIPRTDGISSRSLNAIRQFLARETLSRITQNSRNETEERNEADVFYTKQMIKKIDSLPLPESLRLYLNFMRSNS